MDGVPYPFTSCTVLYCTVLSQHVWLTGPCACPQQGSGHLALVQTLQGKEKENLRSFGILARRHTQINKIKKDDQEHVRFLLTCQGNLCPQQLRYQARDYPSQKVCFHCVETKTDCIMQGSHKNRCEQTIRRVTGSHLLVICLKLGIIFVFPSLLLFIN